MAFRRQEEKEQHDGITMGRLSERYDWLTRSLENHINDNKAQYKELSDHITSSYKELNSRLDGQDEKSFQAIQDLRKEQQQGHDNLRQEVLQCIATLDTDMRASNLKVESDIHWIKMTIWVVSGLGGGILVGEKALPLLEAIVKLSGQI